jgi:hypothetical protein
MRSRIAKFGVVIALTATALAVTANPGRAVEPQPVQLTRWARTRSTPCSYRSVAPGRGRTPPRQRTGGMPAGYARELRRKSSYSWEWLNRHFLRRPSGEGLSRHTRLR